ncbi:uncharacterized protein LOC124299587 [Neodiprion virginianus]|uniref:uncharacterized protein LOC124299587 n=1 Tax=Neodiprion virginianus TaxID=2961670 RepID=UPI001EE71F7E|nr:uncharacterized protein LOC124299587 [Neodiprion virginianus]
MDYSAIFYDTAAKTTRLKQLDSIRNQALRQLDSIRNQALRLSLGAYRTSPINSLLAEAGDSPLKLRRTELTSKYAIKAKTQSENPAFGFMNDKPGTDIIYSSKNTKLKPLRVRIKNILEELNIKVPQPIPRKHSGPPWLKHSIAVNLDMSELPRKTATQQTYPNLFLATQEKYKDHKAYYTDGSVGKGQASCAVVNNRKKKVSDFTTLDRYSHVKPLQSDSMSCLIALQNTENTCSLITNIKESIKSLTCNNRRVSLVWIPGHQGIAGNEEADQLTTEAIDNNIIDELPITTIQDTNKLIKQTIWTQWNDRWLNERQTGLSEIRESATEDNPCIVVKSDNLVSDMSFEIN